MLEVGVCLPTGETCVVNWSHFFHGHLADGVVYTKVFVFLVVC